MSYNAVFIECKMCWLQIRTFCNMQLAPFFNSGNRETLCCTDCGLFWCAGVAAGDTQQLLLTGIPDITRGQYIPSKPSFTRGHALLAYQ